MAAKATFALKAGLCVRRVRFVMIAPDPRGNIAAVRQQSQLSGCPDFPSQLLHPPQHRSAAFN
jgi:hypothetical protein